MNKLILLIVILFLNLSIQAQNQKSNIPQWFLEDLKSNIGTWIADNSEHLSASEPYEKYGMKWKYGIGNTSIVGSLFGIKDGKEIGPFWQFRQYWDLEKNQAVIIQYGWGGTVGAGTYKPLEKGTIESIQTFTTADGRKRVEKHINKVTKEYFISKSFEQDNKNKWTEKRTYKWNKVMPKNEKFDLGKFSLSLSVKDLKASKEFYEMLGFKPVKGMGGIKQKWMILTNGTTRLGLFQGFFPSNTLTFNPKDVRKIHKELQKQGIKPTFSIGLDKKVGKGSLTIVDPDGNPILIDQHN